MSLNWSISRIEDYDNFCWQRHREPIEGHERLEEMVGTQGWNWSKDNTYVYRLNSDLVNREALATGELELGPLGSADAEMLRDLLEQHVEQTGSALAADFLARFDEEVANFVRVVPRDYAAVLRTRQEAVDEGLDPDGDVVWTRILEVTGG